MKKKFFLKKYNKEFGSLDDLKNVVRDIWNEID
jgi:hypothetical protein